MTYKQMSMKFLFVAHMKKITGSYPVFVKTITDISVTQDMNNLNDVAFPSKSGSKYTVGFVVTHLVSVVFATQFIHTHSIP